MAAQLYDGRNRTSFFTSAERTSQIMPNLNAVSQLGLYNRVISGADNVAQAHFIQCIDQVLSDKQGLYGCYGHTPTPRVSP